MRKVQKDWSVVIPRYVRNTLGINVGDKVIFEIINQEVFLRKDI